MDRPSGAQRIYNFGAGPATMPVEVLERAQAELVNWHQAGLSVMEMSHRGTEFVAIAADAEAIYSYEGTREVNTLIVGRAVTGISALT